MKIEGVVTAISESPFKIAMGGKPNKRTTFFFFTLNKFDSLGVHNAMHNDRKREQISLEMCHTVVTRDPKLTEIHDDLFEKCDFKSCTFTVLCKIDPHDKEQWPEWMGP